MSKPDQDYLLSNDDLFLFAKGEWFRSYEKLGAHPATLDGQEGYHFGVWAPDVRSVHVVGEFNDWDAEATALTRTPVGGVWYGFVPGVVEGQLYKYVIETRAGDVLYKADPYAFQAELIPGTASRTAEIDSYEWGDEFWIKERQSHNHMKRPLNIFEVHLGSWKRHDDGLTAFGTEPTDPEEATGSWYTYDDLSDELVSYVKEMGYSHIEVMPVMEHPFDGSWGYQVTGYYAPTSRFGNPKQFKHFMDACHQAGIGVILDWVPGGFCPDEHGLVHFNGTKQFEKEVHPNWGTYKFNFEKGEVRTFLISNLLYWIDEYHADGIRMDGVTSMLYLNFGIDDPGQKKFNPDGSENDYPSIEFVRQCNQTVGIYHPDVMMIAEESTAWPLVTRPPEVGGLGFNYKWDMGWMNDTLRYCQTDFPFRPGNHSLLTFSIMYAFNENFVLPLSHDEVVHGKCSLITRQPGDYWRQMAGLRSLAFYQTTHPGGQLNFMGNEIGQFIEWRYYEGIEYFLAKDYEAHGKHQHYIAALNKFYLEQPALWERAYTEDGFEWIDANNSNQCVISFVRHGDDPNDDLLLVINYEVNPYEEYRIGVPRPGYWREVFNSDEIEFGGSGVTNSDIRFESEEVPWNLRSNSIKVRVPPIGGAIFKYDGPLPPKPKKKTVVEKHAEAKAKAAAQKKSAKKVAAQAKATAKKVVDKAKSDAEAAALKAKRSAAAKKAAATRKANAAKKAAEEAAAKAAAE
ncbi:MAG: 1,4-alpha-glucan branching protein GlgB [Atopobiaceae bacterium]|nr:1,4-alpha-glucan branching protein GlgB [Atopobiaceae bacterium]MBR3314719.1 1,4-alpha-glucan branching protein GlgB [Atopobiaceae bacterium]